MEKKWTILSKTALKCNHLCLMKMERSWSAQSALWVNPAESKKQKKDQLQLMLRYKPSTAIQLPDYDPESQRDHLRIPKQGTRKYPHQKATIILTVRLTALVRWLKSEFAKKNFRSYESSFYLNLSNYSWFYSRLSRCVSGNHWQLAWACPYYTVLVHPPLSVLLSYGLAWPALMMRPWRCLKAWKSCESCAGWPCPRPFVSFITSG